MDVPLAVTRLTLTRFRNYTQTRVAVPPWPVVISGPNGSGKTNLLEAISLLAPGRGLRQARLGEMEQLRPISDPEAMPPEPGPSGPGLEDTTGWAVAATVQSPDYGTVDIGTGTVSSGGSGGDRRVVRIDGRNTRSTALAEHLALIWLTPQMDGLLVEGSGSRRRFLDRMVFGLDPAHAGRLSRYEKVLRDRAHLLREGRRDDAWLKALEDTLATTGVAIAAARADFVQRLDRACRGAVGPFPAATVALTGRVDNALADRPALTVEDGLRADYRASRDRDADMGGSAVGPHRSDLLVTYVEPGTAPPGRPMHLCSTGEQKALLIALVLAHARVLERERGAPPILLLDDVAAHLDAERRAALFGEILSLRCQAWMTGTDTSLFASLDAPATWLGVRHGSIVEA